MKRHLWPLMELAAVFFSAWLLYGELCTISLDDLWDSLTAIPLRNWGLAFLATVAAYAALAGYDHIALKHLGRHVDWRYVTMC